MPRRKAAEVEILPPEDGQQPRGRKKLVEAEHTIKYSAPVPVTVEDDSTENNLEEDFDFAEEEKAKRRKKTAKDERRELQRELDKLGVAAVSRLKLSIDKYRHSDSDDSGTLAEKDYCIKYPVTKAHILNDEYMDIARRYGPGRYWFTLRMDNVIARQWERQVSQAVIPTSPMIQNVNPSDPNSPQVVVNMPEGTGQPIGVVDPIKQMRETAKMYKELKQAFEPEGAQPAQPAQSTDPEVILLQNLASNERFMDKVNGGLIKKLFGAGAVDDEPSWSAVGMEAVKSGQLAGAIDAAFRGLAGLVNMILPRRDNNNGQAPMEQAPLAQNARSENPPQHHTSPDQFRESLPVQSQSQGSQSIVEAGANASPGQQQQITPAEQALATVIADCQKKVPPQITFTNLMTFADAINDQAPAYSIDGWIEYFGGMPIDGAIEFVKTLPNGEATASLPHAKEWCADLQRLIKEAGQEGEDE